MQGFYFSSQLFHQVLLTAIGDLRKITIRLLREIKYIENLKFGTRYIFQGFLYKFIIGYVFGTLWLPQLAKDAIFYGQANGDYAYLGLCSVICTATVCTYSLTLQDILYLQ